MTTFRTKAIVLRRTNYGEADRILQLLTPEHGKVSVIARGVRREKSKLAGAVELFAVSDVTVSSGRGELGILTSARLDTFFGKILEDYDRLQFGYEAVKQIDRAATTVEEEAFYRLLEQALIALNTSEIDLRVIKTWFFLQLAILLGVGANLATDMSGEKLVEGERYSFSENDESFVMDARGRFTSGHIKLLRILSAHGPAVAMQVKNFDELIGDCLWLAERGVF